MKNKEVIIIGYSNVTPEGVALHTNIPATLKEGGVKSRVTWVSWDNIGDLLFKDYTEEKTVEGLNELRSKKNYKRMKVINKQNQHEIGFDIDCLPAWAEYIAMDSDKYWFFYADDLLPYKDDGVWLNFSLFSIIPEEYEPKNYVGSWEDSLFKIDRSEMVKYNGTAI